MPPTPDQWFWLGIKLVLLLGLFVLGLVLVLANVIDPHRHVSRRAELGTRVAGVVSLLGALGVLVSVIVG